MHGESLQVLGDALFEREELISELKRSNDELTRCSYTVSHDLEAPVRTVLTELVARRGRGKVGDSEAQMLDMVVQAADEMQQLIWALLAYAQAGNAAINREAMRVEGSSARCAIYGRTFQRSASFRSAHPYTQ